MKYGKAVLGVILVLVIVYLVMHRPKAGLESFFACSMTNNGKCNNQCIYGGKSGRFCNKTGGACAKTWNKCN